jgi:outer membrane immunogenic protein
MAIGGDPMRTALLTATLLFFASSAYAADMPVKAPTAPPAPSWTGWYVGINGGGGWGSADTTTTDIGPFPDGFFATANIPAVTAGGTQHIKTSGGLAGAQVGYLYQAGPAIVGIEAGYDWQHISGSAHNGPTPYPVTPASAFSWNLRAKSEGLFTVLGRIGPDLGMWFPYVTTGVAATRLNYSANFVDTFYPSNVTNAFSKDAAAWVIGAGAEFRFAQHWMLRGEFLHMDFGSVSGFGPIACNSPGVGNCIANRTNFSFASKFNENVGRVALSYKF